MKVTVALSTPDVRSDGLEQASGKSCALTEALSRWSDTAFAPFVGPASRRFAGQLSLPTYVLELLFLIEDKRFAIHFGLDPFAVARAIVFNARGCTRQGASTLVQQVYDIRRQRNGHQRTASWRRKIRQIAWAVWKSASISKAELLGEYLRTVYWGGSYYGLERASHGYFGIDPRDLSVAQGFFLAERIAAPNRYSAERVAVLLRRHGIMHCLERHGASSRDILAVYEQQIGGPWRSQAK